MSSTTCLGRLEQVDLRKVWLNEAGHFTPWLAQDDNIALLADTLGLDLKVEALEKGVGPYRADIVCRDTTDGTLVLIENQLEKTNHVHLGQLLTYAAGLDAVTVVWIAERFTDEHRAALDWLNEITSERVGFFGLEIELWRIGNSPVAPKFNVVSRPNDWIKVSSGGGGGGANLSETQELQFEYWKAFLEHAKQSKSNLKMHKALPQHWLTVSIGRSNFHMAGTINTLEERIAVELYLGGADAKKHFAQLFAEKEVIDKAIGGALEWMELPNRKASRILQPRANSNIKHRANWPEQHKWMLDTFERFDTVFRPRVKALPGSYEDEDDQEEAEA